MRHKYIMTIIRILATLSATRKLRENVKFREIMEKPISWDWFF